MCGLLKSHSNQVLSDVKEVNVTNALGKLEVVCMEVRTVCFVGQ